MFGQTNTREVDGSTNSPLRQCKIGKIVGLMKFDGAYNITMLYGYYFFGKRVFIEKELGQKWYVFFSISLISLPYLICTHLSHSQDPSIVSRKESKQSKASEQPHQDSYNSVLQFKYAT